MNRCHHCGGTVIREDVVLRDGIMTVDSCLMCGRSPGPPRPHEEPVVERNGGDFIPGLMAGVNGGGMWE